jgi:hypothetical protein
VPKLATGKAESIIRVIEAKTEITTADQQISPICHQNAPNSYSSLRSHPKNKQISVFTGFSVVYVTGPAEQVILGGDLQKLWIGTMRIMAGNTCNYTPHTLNVFCPQNFRDFCIRPRNHIDWMRMPGKKKLSALFFFFVAAVTHSIHVSKGNTACGCLKLCRPEIFSFGIMYAMASFASKIMLGVFNCCKTGQLLHPTRTEYTKYGKKYNCLILHLQA